MGAYLSEPITEKISTDEANELLSCGASSMQGWRMSQEDAHNANLDFDKNTSFFAVYDGHGGAEVALYCASKLPQFLKLQDEYKKGNFEQALRDAFISFDGTLTADDIIEELKKLIPGDKRDGDSELDDASDADEDMEDLDKLCSESRMPLNEVLEKYVDIKQNPLLNKLKKGEASGSKPISPYLRGRRNNDADDDAGASGSGSSSSGASASCSSSRNSKLVFGEAEEATVSSSSAAAKAEKMKIENEAICSTNAAEVCPSRNGNGTSKQINVIAENGSTQNGPSSSASSSNEANSIKLSDKANCNSPDSSSTNNKSNEIPASSSSSSEAKTLSNVDNQPTVNGVETATLVAGASTKPSQENEISTNSVKPENVSSSSTENNGVVSSNSSNNIEKVSTNNISSTIAESKKPKKMPPLNDDDDDSSTEDDEDGSYNEEKSTTEDGEDIDIAEESEDDDDTEDDEDDLYPGDDEDDGFLNNMIEGPGWSSGCTAVVSLLVERDLYVANAGDSRCVVCRNGQALEMSLDHKPEDTEELQRITKAGGRVTLDGRVNGGLNLSRAIGDHAYKINKELKPEEQMISALPDIKRITLTPEDEFMIIACDGIWNFMTSEEVVEFVRERLKTNPAKLSSICEELFTNCLATNTMGDGTGCDNMTAVIVQFKSKLLESADKVEEATNNKRSAEDETDQEQNNKRIKTDQVECLDLWTKSTEASVSYEESSEAAAAAESITENT